jgi:hypothetical protein
MTQAVFRIESLPRSAVEAAAKFYSDYLPQARDALSQESLSQDALSQGMAALAIVLPPAEPDHYDWRLAAIRDLARAHAPMRVNIVSGEDASQIEAVLAYLRDAPGVTGQYLTTHD